MSISDILELSGIILTGIWVLLKFVFRLERNDTEINSKLNNLNKCFIAFSTDTKEYMEKTNNKIDDVKEKISAHSANLAVINSILNIDGFAMTSKNSPRKLKPVGKKLFKEIDGEQFLKDNKEQLFQKIDRMSPLTKYDVEQDSMMALMALTGNPVFNHIKDIVYEMPEIKLDDGSDFIVTIHTVCTILSIPLRDMYLAEKWRN